MTTMEITDTYFSSQMHLGISIIRAAGSPQGHAFSYCSRSCAGSTRLSHAKRCIMSSYAHAVTITGSILIIVIGYDMYYTEIIQQNDIFSE